MKPVLCLLGMLCLFTSCSSSLSFMSWVEGDWVMSLAGGSSRIESWTFMDKNLFLGKGLKVTGQDSVLKESLKLMYRDEAIWYIPTVPDQNNAEAVPFKLVKQERKDFVFENPDHDFPQRIMYRYIPASEATSDADSMYVRVESLEGEGIDYWFRKQ